MVDLSSSDTKSGPPRWLPRAMAAPAPANDAITIDVAEQEDGSVDVTIGPDLVEEAPAESAGFDENVAALIGDAGLSSIADDLIRGIDADIDSRREWTAFYAEGLELLGLRVEKRETGNRQHLSVVRHPLLLESIIRGQAQARGELLPASGEYHQGRWPWTRADYWCGEWEQSENDEVKAGDVA